MNSDDKKTRNGLFEVQEEKKVCTLSYSELHNMNLELIEVNKYLLNQIHTLTIELCKVKAKK